MRNIPTSCLGGLRFNPCLPTSTNLALIYHGALVPPGKCRNITSNQAMTTALHFKFAIYKHSYHCMVHAPNYCRRSNVELK